jgi:hypothetical protein
MTRTPIPVRHWRTYGDYPLPSGIEAPDEPFAAFQSGRPRKDRTATGSLIDD